MDYLYSLYHALISVNVPSDQARAVVDAMERDMTTTIATKTDLQLLKQEFESLINTSTGDLRHELRQETATIRKDMEILSNRIDNRIDLLSTTMTVRLGSMLVVALGVLFAALRLT